MTVPRPLLRWHGGKWLLAPWIIDRFPTHQCYVEPFGGAASVLLRKERSYSEVYNDLDRVLVDLFAVLRDPDLAAQLIAQLELTPFSRVEFDQAYVVADDPVEAARRTIIRSFMGFGSDSTAGHYRTGFRSNTTRMGTTPARDWSNYPEALRAIVRRLDGVTFESKPAIDVMRQYDQAKTLHYVDPPYHPSTRSTGNRRRCGPGRAAWHVYKHELEHNDHVALLDALRSLQGMVVLSGYPTALYDEALADWRRIERPHYADGASPRTEVLWLNPALIAATGNGPLFEAAA